jgi:DNA-binding transcriptional LysR family regulator
VPRPAIVNPNLKQLEALYWAGRLGSFQAAANRLHTTQSAISKRIAELEEGLGRKLFDRSRRNAKLTPAGERVSEGAEQMLSIVKGLVESSSEPDEYESVFRLAATELTAMTWLPGLLSAIRLDHPRLRVEVEIHGGGTLLEQLNRSRYDLALLPGPMWGRLYEALPMQALERAWMASPAMRVPSRGLTVEQLSRFSIGSQYPDTIHAQLQAAWFNKAGFPLRNLVLSHSFTVLGELAKKGVVIAQLPVGFYADAIRRRELVRIKVTPDLPDAQYFAVYRRGTAHRLAARIAALAQAQCDFSGSAVKRPR